MSNLIKKEDIPNILQEIEDAYFDIPFGNSRFQNQMFVANGQHTPARAYRAIGLRMFNRIRALKEAMYARAKEDIDIEEMREKLKDPNISKYERARLELEIQQRLDNRKYIDKLIHDALVELTDLYAMFKKFPKYTREQFEAEERKHFEIRLKKQALGITGALESLDNMGIDISKPISLEEVRQLEDNFLEECILRTEQFKSIEW